MSATTRAEARRARTAGSRPTRSGTSSRFVWATAVVSSIAIAIASAALWPVYASTAFLLVVAGGILVGQTIAVVGARRGTGPWIMTVWAVAAFALVGVPLAVPSLAIARVLPSPDGLVALAEGVVLSWKRLLTIATPVGDYQALLVPALLLVLLATILTTSIALRTRLPELATAVPPLLLVAGIVLGPGGSRGSAPGNAVVVSALLAGVLLLWLTGLRERRAAVSAATSTDVTGAVAFSRGDRRRSVVSSIIAAVIVVVVAVTAATGAVALLPPAGERAVARDAVERPFNPRDYPSPLSTFRAYHRDGRADEVMLTAEGLASPRIRLAVMDDFDGVVWNVGSAEDPSASGSFERLPFRLDPTVAGTPSTTTVTIGSYEGVWLPGSGYLGSVEFAGERRASLADSLYYNANAGTAAVTAELRTGDGYTVDAVEPELVAPDGVGSLVPGGAADKPGDSPEGLLDVLDAYSTAGAAPGENLAAVLEGIRSVGYISHGVGDDEPASPSGHGLDRLSRLLSDSPMVGDGEQYASLAALAARQLGFPSRVVMGFANTTGATDGPVAFTGSDIAAWIEVRAAGRGWVAIDPTPEERPVPEEQPEDPTLIARPYQDLQPQPEEEPDRSEQTAPDSSEPEDQPVLDPFLAVLLQIARVLSWVVIVVAVILSPFIAVIAAKARRRSLRRRTPDPADRVVAGWREFRDAVVDHGIEPPPSVTRHELADLHGARGAHRLAVLADRVTFSTMEPSDGDADRAWSLVDDLRASLDSRVDRRGRLLALVSLRSLGLRRGTSSPARRAPTRGRRETDHVGRGNDD
ncbi:DUF4129 domain-containing protein [Labedella phragmitis]|uniref:DUF4129 domain-containing protein n=1 Tax=Labedella phragmitis TaxID=2498849 RepID=A0A3S3Z220_9MICO|nr:transglutaminase domain-containing protein [Labedella phragmitis]RWZ50013.1 DUF4129 domain-containing protein [Labedella phragmitis]